MGLTHTFDPCAPNRIPADSLAQCVRHLSPGQTLRVEPDEGWSESDMRQEMELAGLVDIQTFSDFAERRFGLEGTKPAKPKPLPKIAALMSMPRLAFGANMFSAINVAVQLGLYFERGEGAYWHQILEEMASRHVEDGEYEYLLTIDYDTLFNAQHIRQLVDIAQRHPEADIIAPVQCKRESALMLFRPMGPDGTPATKATSADFEGELTPVEWAHFGLTLIRCSSLRNIPHPWFTGIPNGDGRWGEGRVDPDIYFWRHMRAHGVQPYLANHVSIGHLQLVATWPGQDFQPLNQHVNDWNAHGQPKEARR